MRIFFCFLLLTLFQFGMLSAQMASSDMFSFSFMQNQGTAGIVPSFDVGTHKTGVSAHFYGKYLFPVYIGEDLFGYWDLSGRAAYRHFETYYGVNQRCEVGEFSLIFGFDFGKRNELPVTFLHGAGTHNLLYHFITYLSTDGTSQNGGEFIYEWIENGGLLQFRYYNDWYGWEFTDGFRTAASELSYSRIVGKDIIGGGFGFSLWTASIKEVGWLQRGQVYDLSGQYGSWNSHGIVYLTFLYNGIRLSLGWDSEKIRSFIQDNAHWVMDDGIIPPLNREDRFFLQLSLFDIGSLY